MLDEYRIEQMGVGAYVDSIDEEVITVDQAVQRAFCWSNEMINNLIYSTVSPKRIYIPNIILAEEKREDGLTTTYVVDGGQRTEALRRFVFDGHKISKSIRNRYVTYQGNKLDKNGKPMRDENGKLIKEIKTFDLVNKTYNDFPPELKKRMRSCQLSAAIYQECTPEDRLYVFNLIIEGNRVGTKEMADFCDGNNLLHVPIISTEYYLPKTMEEMKLEADGYSEINPKVRREGYVYRSQDGQQSFKNVSREYLLKHNG